MEGSDATLLCRLQVRDLSATKAALAFALLCLLLMRTACPPAPFQSYIRPQPSDPSAACGQWACASIATAQVAAVASVMARAQFAALASLAVNDAYLPRLLGKLGAAIVTKVPVIACNYGLAIRSLCAKLTDMLMQRQNQHQAKA